MKGIERRLRPDVTPAALQRTNHKADVSTWRCAPVDMATLLQSTHDIGLCRILDVDVGIARAVL